MARLIILFCFLPDACVAIWHVFVVYFLPNACKAIWLIFLCVLPEASEAKWHMCCVFRLMPPRLYSICCLLFVRLTPARLYGSAYYLILFSA